MSTEAPGRTADDMRVAFEASYLQRLGEAAQFVKVYRLLRQSDDTYRQYLVQAEWVGWQAAWQASRAAALEDCLNAIDGERLMGPITTHGDAVYERAIDDCETALKALEEPAK